MTTGGNGCYMPKRYIVLILTFLGVLITYTLKIDLNEDMLILTKENTQEFLNFNLNVSESSHITDKSGFNTDAIKAEHYIWNTASREQITESYFYAYFSSMLIGGFLAERFSAKHFFSAGVLLSCIFSLLTLVSVSWEYISLVIAIRCLSGLSEGVVLPSAMIIISRWSPKSERSRFCATVFNAAAFGIVFSFPVSDSLGISEISSQLPVLFYVTGVLICAWYSTWFLLISDKPQKHPTITQEEISLYPVIKEKISWKRKLPRVSIFISVPVWVAFVANFGTYFMNIILLKELPTYLSNGFHFEHSETIFLITIPHLMEPSGGWTAAYLADKLRNTYRLPITTVRKIMNSVAGYGLSLCVIGMAMFGDHPYIVLLLMNTGMFIYGFRSSGYIATYMDMSPNFTGTTFGICNALSSLTGIIGPLVVTSFTKHGDMLSNWSGVFYATAGIEITATTLFALFASAELQQWGKFDTMYENEEERSLY